MNFWKEISPSRKQDERWWMSAQFPSRTFQGRGCCGQPWMDNEAIWLCSVAFQKVVTIQQDCLREETWGFIGLLTARHSQRAPCSHNQGASGAGGQLWCKAQARNCFRTLSTKVAGPPHASSQGRDIKGQASVLPSPIFSLGEIRLQERCAAL